MVIRRRRLFRVFGFGPLLLLGAGATAVAIAAVTQGGNFRAAAPISATPDATALYEPGDGPFHPVTKSGVILHDPKRNKDLRVTVTYPSEQGRYPTIVFSHGAGGSGDTYAPLTRYWATHGYVVIQPTHTDSVSLTSPGQPARGMLNALDTALHDSTAWQERPRDISFLLDSLDELERLIPDLKGKAGTRRIGVGGHSFGAQTALLIGGATIDLPGGKMGESFADPRPRAILVLSPEGSGQMGFTGSSWRGLTRPMLTMTGTRDFWSPTRGPEWRKEPFTGAPPGDKFHILIDGATHMSFTGRTLMQSSAEDAIFADIKSASLCFWDAYLKTDPMALAYLRSIAFTTATNGKVHLERK